MNVFERIAREHIQHAISDAQFKGLQGQGKPLQGILEKQTNGKIRLKHKILRAMASYGLESTCIKNFRLN